MNDKNYTELGIKIIPVKNIDEFRTEISKLHHGRDPWELGFRGQENTSWELKPSLFRYLENINYDQNRFSLKKAANVLEEYYREALIGNSDIAQETIKDMDIWHLGQHYGMATPQLDWTYSPWVALFFTAEKPVQIDNELAAVWVLDMNVLNIMNEEIRRNIWPKNNSLTIGGEFTEKFPLMEIQIMNDENNRRLSSQQGFFSKHEYYHTFEVWLKKALELLKWDMRSTNGPLYKITIPKTEINRNIILRELQLMNITPRTLFPDIWGCSKEAMYKMEQYIKASHRSHFIVDKKK